MEQKFYFRQNVEDLDTKPHIAELSINEIVNGNGTFKGLIYYIRAYMKTTDMSGETEKKVENYLELICRRASGGLLTPASWMRKFVNNHEMYKKDSRVSEEVNYDMMWKIYRLANGELECPDLLP